MIAPRYFILLLLVILSSCLAETLSTGEEVSAYVTRMIEENEVSVFAKSYCPYCKATRSLLKSLESTFDIEPSIVDLDLLVDNDGPLIQQELLQRTGQRTVPSVFIGTKHIGGNSDFQQLVAEGKFAELLNDKSKTASSPEL